MNVTIERIEKIPHTDAMPILVEAWFNLLHEGHVNNGLLVAMLPPA